MESYTLQESTNKLVPSSSALTNARERHVVLTHLARLYGVPRITSFPGGHPSTVGRGDVETLGTERCFFSLKTDGVRYLMLLCHIGGAPHAVMVDRRLRMYEVAVTANDDFFERPTLLDGELVLDHRTNRLCYQVFDVVSMRGRHFHAEPYCNRLQVLHDRLLTQLPPGVDEDSEAADEYVAEEDKLYAPRSNRMQLTMTPKRFVTSDNARALWEGRHESPFPTDGLIVNFDRSPIQCGTLRTTLKWKPHNAIDVVVDDGMKVCCRNAGVEEPLAELRVGGRTHRVQLSDNHLVQWLVHRKRGRMLVECLVEVQGGVVTLWPMKERSDKAEANDLRIIEATLDTIAENVSFDQLLAAAQGEVQGAAEAKAQGTEGAARSDSAPRAGSSGADAKAPARPPARSFRPDRRRTADHPSLFRAPSRKSARRSGRSGHADEAPGATAGP